MIRKRIEKSLQIEFENLSNAHFIASYSNNSVVINENKYYHKIIIFNSAIEECKNVKNLFSETFFNNKIKQLNRREYNFILFGTGKKTKKIPQKTCEFIIRNNIPYESMKSVSAFKTYNILTEKKFI